MSEFSHQQFEGTVHGEFEAAAYQVFETFKVEAQGEHLFMTVSGEAAWFRFGHEGELIDLALDTTELLDDYRTVTSLHRTPHGFIASKAQMPFVENESVPFDDSQSHKIRTFKPEIIDYADIHQLINALSNIDQHFGELSNTCEILSIPRNNDRLQKLYKKVRYAGAIALNSLGYVSPYTLMLTAGHLPLPKQF